MDVGAIVLSVLALVIAGVGVFFAYRQAKSANEQAKAALESVDILKSQDWKHRTPEFEGAVQFVGPRAHKLTLTLRSPWPLSGLRAAIANGEGARFSDFRGTDIAEVPSSGPLAPGEAVQWWLAVDEPHPESVTLRVACMGDGAERWTVFPVIRVFPGLEELTPRIEGDVEWVGDRAPYRLRLRLHLLSPRPLASLEATIVGGHGLAFVAGGSPQGTRSTKARWANVTPNKSAQGWLAHDDGYSGHLRLQLSCVGRKGESWTVHEIILMPFPL